MLYNIVSFQSSPDIQNYIITSSALILLFNFNFTMFIWPNACSISALPCGIGYIIRIAQNQPVFRMGFPRRHLHTSIFQSNILLCQYSTFCQRTIIKFYHWYSLFPMSLLSSLSISNLSKN